MDREFQLVLDEYLLDKSNRVSSDKSYHKALVHTLPDMFYQFLDKNKYKVSGSCGNGYKASVPWLCVFDKRVTTSARHGVYITFLFKEDMSGFYMNLGQGITFFEENYGKKAYKCARKMSDYYYTKIEDNYFSKDPIDLKSSRKSLGNGYEVTNIISRFYESNNFNTEDIISDFKRMLKIYDEVVNSLSSYEEIVNEIINSLDEEIYSFVGVDKANEILDKYILDELDEDEINDITISETNPPVLKETLTRTSTGNVKCKINYEMKTKRDVAIGKKGEKLVLKKEIAKLKNKNREDLIKYVKMVSDDDDTLGYDIVSYDIDSYGNASKIFIEVKTTTSGKNSGFYISNNEYEKMNSNKDSYWIYRVFNVMKKKPQFYRMNKKYLDENYKMKITGYYAEVKNHSNK